MSMLRLLCIGAIALPLASVAPSADETSTTRQAFESGESFANVPPAPWVDDDPADSLYRAARQALNDESYRRAAALFAQIESRYPRSVYTPDAPYWRAFALYKAGREDDLRALADAFLDNISDTELAMRHHRTKSAIKEMHQGFECARGNLVEDQISPVAQTWVARWRKLLAG